ncbi:MAG: polysaccharide deacetylase family protein [Clostridia bacterium]|nr:polysaccharide deacetylase family protein [Clostridia bacterium]
MSKLITLMYHDVYIDNPNESGIATADCATYKISNITFEEHLKAIRKLINEGSIQENQIRITFDDGGDSFFKIIMPILDKYGFKGYFFIATGFVGQKGFLTESMIKELHTDGHIVGAHSHSHQQRMHTLSNEILMEDWGFSMKYLSNIIGQQVTDVSLPNGYQSKGIMSAVLNNGAKDIYTSNPLDEVKHAENYNEYGRYAIRENMTADDVVALIKNNGLRRKMRLKFKLLGIVKTVLGDTYLKLREKVLGNKDY